MTKIRKQGVPAVGTLFRYQGARYRLTAYMKEQPIPDLPDGLVGEMLARIRAEEAACLPKGMRLIRLHWCLPEEATHVSGTGIAGCIAALEEIDICGTVKWPESLLEDAHAHAHAIELAKEGELATTITGSVPQAINEHLTL